MSRGYASIVGPRLNTLPLNHHSSIAVKVTLYHNPRCSKSREALALLEARGADLAIVKYLETPPDEKTLANLRRALGGNARDMIRSGETAYRELGLDDPALDDATLLRAVADHPILLQRPIAVVDERAVIGRPPEQVLQLLD